jgi:Holliday junction resolvase
MTQAESRLSRNIMEACRERGAFAFKIHGSPTMMAGLPDIMVCYRGFFFALETKTPQGGDPKPIQAHVMEKIRQAHGIAVVVRSVDDAMRVLDIAHSLEFTVRRASSVPDVPNTS